MVNTATRAVCALAAITSLIIVCARSSGLQSSDLPFLALVIAPYLLLGLMTGRMSERGTTARILFIVTLVLSLVGTALLALNSPYAYTGPEPGLAQTITIIILPLLQCIAAIVLGLILLLRRMMAS